MSLLNLGKFSFVLFFTQVFTGTLMSYWGGEPDINSQIMWLSSQYALYTLMSTIVFIALAMKHYDKPYLGAFLVAIIAEGLGFLTSAILAGEFLDPFAMLFDIPAILFAVFLGTSIGVRIRSC